jgi:hypothetical protein
VRSSSPIAWLSPLTDRLRGTRPAGTAARRSVRACSADHLCTRARTLLQPRPRTQHASTAPLTPRCTFVPNSRAASPESGGGAHKRQRQQSSRYLGDCWDKADTSSKAYLKDPQTKRKSRYLGVCWDKANTSWNAYLRDPQTKRNQHIGCYDSEEDAARAYDFAAVQALGPGAKCNFPEEAISKPPVSRGEEKKQRGSSRYIGVSWDKRRDSWRVQLADPQTKRNQRIGCYDSEEDAARAYDFAAVQARGSGAKRNFPAEDISEPPVSKDGSSVAAARVEAAWQLAAAERVAAAAAAARVAAAAARVAARSSKG